MPDTIEFRGSYQYATESMLEAALAMARERIGAELDDHLAVWSECFTRDTTVLHVHARLPVDATEVFTLRVLRTLADTAMTGAIEARHGEHALEYHFVETISSNDNDEMD